MAVHLPRGQRGVGRGTRAGARRGWAWALSHNKTRCRCCWGYGEEPQSQRAHARTPGRWSSFRRSWEAGRGWNKKLVSLSRHEPHRPTLSWWPGSAQPASSGQRAGRLLAPVGRTGPQASQCRWRDACGSPWGAWAACSAVVCLQAAQAAAALGFPQAHAARLHARSGWTRCSGKLSVCALSPRGNLK